MTKVLVIATSHKTRGGITSVVLAHKKGQQWKDFHCRWLETHRDGSLWVKLAYMLKAFLLGMFLIPRHQLVHIHLSEPPSALRKLPFMWWAKTWRKKTIVHFHSFSPDTTINGKYSFLYRYLFMKADRVIVLSEYWKKEVTKVMPLVSACVIYNPCLAVVKKQACGSVNYDGIQPQMHSILYAGTVNHRKGYDDLVKAFGKIGKKYINWQLVFAGNGEIENGKMLAKEFGISNQVVWLGWVNGGDKEKAFQESSVFCLPSYAEGFPMSVLDAWSYGLPVITTPVGGIPDVAKNGENMLLFAPGDIDALAVCLERMITDIELRKKISRASLDFAQYKFNINTINKEIGDLYEQVLGV